jgi:hypothetical protein
MSVIIDAASLWSWRRADSTAFGTALSPCPKGSAAAHCGPPFPAGRPLCAWVHANMIRDSMTVKRARAVTTERLGVRARLVRALWVRLVAFLEPACFSFDALLILSGPVRCRLCRQRVRSLSFREFSRHGLAAEDPSKPLHAESVRLDVPGSNPGPAAAVLSPLGQERRGPVVRSGDRSRQ